MGIKEIKSRATCTFAAALCFLCFAQSMHLDINSIVVESIALMARLKRRGSLSDDAIFHEFRDEGILGFLFLPARSINGNLVGKSIILYVATTRQEKSWQAGNRLKA